MKGWIARYTLGRLEQPIDNNNDVDDNDEDEVCYKLDEANVVSVHNCLFGGLVPILLEK